MFRASEWKRVRIQDLNFIMSIFESHTFVCVFMMQREGKRMQEGGWGEGIENMFLEKSESFVEQKMWEIKTEQRVDVERFSFFYDSKMWPICLVVSYRPKRVMPSCHSCKGVESHVWVIRELLRIGRVTISRMEMSHITRNRACHCVTHVRRWVRTPVGMSLELPRRAHWKLVWLSLLWMSHVTHMNLYTWICVRQVHVFYTYGWVMAHI